MYRLRDFLMIFHSFGDTPSSFRNNLIQPNHAYYCFGLRELFNAMHWYPALVSTNDGYWYILFKADVSLSLIGWENTNCIIKRIEDVIWFGVFRLISSLFGENLGCPWEKQKTQAEAVDLACTEWEYDKTESKMETHTSYLSRAHERGSCKFFWPV